MIKFKILSFIFFGGYNMNNNNFYDNNTIYAKLNNIDLYHLYINDIIDNLTFSLYSSNITIL